MLLPASYAPHAVLTGHARAARAAVIRRLLSMIFSRRCGKRGGRTSDIRKGPP